jgi:hypothetical protein
MSKFASFVVGLFVGVLGGAAAVIYLQAQRVVPQDDIVFAAKNFYDASNIQFGYVAVSGTLTGDGLAYPNNTRSISCWSDIKQCYVSEIEQIGRNQIGRMTNPYPYSIVKWTPTEVVAQEEVPCFRTTITIDRASQNALWVQEPINQTKPNCKDSDTQIRKYSLEDSPGWKKIFGKR